MILYYDRINKKQTGIFRNEDETIISTDDRVKAFWEPRASNEDLAFDNNGLPYVKTYAMQADGTRYSHYLDTPDIDGIYQPDTVKIEAELQAQAEAEFRAKRDELLKEADIKIFKLQDNGQDQTAWRQYRQALRDSTDTWVLPVKPI